MLCKGYSDKALLSKANIVNMADFSQRIIANYISRDGGEKKVVISTTAEPVPPRLSPS